MMQTQNVTFPKCFEFMDKELSNIVRGKHFSRKKEVLITFMFCLGVLEARANKFNLPLAEGLIGAFTVVLLTLSQRGGL